MPVLPASQAYAERRIVQFLVETRDFYLLLLGRVVPQGLPDDAQVIGVAMFDLETVGISIVSMKFEALAANENPIAARLVLAPPRPPVQFREFF